MMMRLASTTTSKLAYATSQLVSSVVRSTGRTAARRIEVTIVLQSNQCGQQSGHIQDKQESLACQTDRLIPPPSVFALKLVFHLRRPDTEDE